jgi:hypothetical protein
MVLTDEENEIIEFYDQGMTIEAISYCTGRSVYRLKKFLEPMPKGHYVFRQLDEPIPDCQVFPNN